MSATTIPSVKELRDIIIDLIQKEGLDDLAYRDMLDYSLELFNEQNLNKAYYGYHNTSHELIVTYNTILASRGKEFKNIISQDDLKHLFAAALFHDYEPEKTSDKPHEKLAADFVIIDRKLNNLFIETSIDPYLVANLILRTTYPWESIKEKITPMMSKYFSSSKYADDKIKQEHYQKLGWFMSVADRIGGYSLGNFLDAIELAKKNAHSLGWDPQYIVRRSIVYFEYLLNYEEEMTDKVMRSLPASMRKVFMDNVIGFFKLREKELEVKNAIEHNKLQLVTKVEKQIDEKLSKILFDIYDELPDPLQFKKKTFFESLNDPKTIIVTLRLGTTNEVIGFAKGGNLESYSLPNIIKDKNHGLQNTIFLEPLALKMGYWGQGGGPQMRKTFSIISKEKGYKFLTSLQLREVIQKRIDRKDNIEFVMQLNPERLDYYRVTL